jgi:chromosome segregation ATPase
MSTITSVNPSSSGIAADAPAPVAKAEQASTGQYTPLWLVGAGDSRQAFELLGIRMPNANGDIAALLAEVSLNLEKSIDESRKKRAASDFAGLAAALASTGLASAQANVGKREDAVDNAKATLDEIKARMDPLEQQRDVQNARIHAYRDEIENLEAALSDPELDPGTRAVLSANLAAAKAGLSDAMQSREAIDIQLSYVRIDGLDSQVANLEAQLAAADPDSEEADTIQAQLDAARADAQDARAELEAFQQGPKTDAARDDFSKHNIEALHASVKNLEDRLPGYEAALASAVNSLQTVMYFALAMAANFATVFQTQQSHQANHDGIRDQGIERAFERIVENLDEASEAALALTKRLDRSDDARKSDIQRERVQAVASGIVSLLSDLVSTLSQLDTAQLPAGFVPPTAANRIRLDV